DFLGHTDRDSGRIVAADGNQNHETRRNFSRDAVFNGCSRAAHTLDNGSHVLCESKGGNQHTFSRNILTGWRLSILATTACNEGSALGMYCRKCLWPLTRPRKPYAPSACMRRCIAQRRNFKSNSPLIVTPFSSCRPR